MSRPRDDLVSSNHELYEKTELNDGENKKCGISSTVRTYMSDTSKNKNSLTTTLNQGRGGGSSSSKILSPPRKIPVPCLGSHLVHQGGKAFGRRESLTPK